jgi:putative ABC transport system permease protein
MPELLGRLQSAVQLGLCMVLLVGAGLLARSYSPLQQVPIGLDPHNVVTAELRLPATKYDNDTLIAEFGRQALKRLRATPGVRSAALVEAMPLSGNWGVTSYRLKGPGDTRQPPPDHGALRMAQPGPEHYGSVARDDIPPKGPPRREHPL